MRPKIVRICTALAMAVFLIGFTIAYTLAYVVGGSKSPPGTYSIVNNYISDLGNYKYTPVPYLFDTICIVTAILLAILFTYINKVLLHELDETKESLTPKRIRLLNGIRLLGFIGSIVGLVGFSGVGVFSEGTRIGDFKHMHYVVSVIVWSGFAIGSLGLGLLAVLRKIFIPKPLGVFMIIGPLASVVLFAIAEAVQGPSQPLEWVMLVAIFWWTIPIGVIILKMTR